MLAAANRSTNETGILEDVDVLGDSDQRHRVASCQLRDGCAVRPELIEYAPADRIRDCAIDGVESMAPIFNHLVYHTPASHPGQPQGVCRQAMPSRWFVCASTTWTYVVWLGVTVTDLDWVT